MATKPIDEKYLAGLVFTGATAKEVLVDGAKKVKHIPFERPLKAGDVLDWADKGGSITIVTADGRKHNVEKKAEKAAAGKEAGK